MKESLSHNTQPFSLKYHRGRFIMCYQGADGSRRQCALKATENGAAVIEATYIHNKMVKESSSERALTISEIWEAYSLYLGDNSISKQMKSEGRSILPAFGHLLPSEINTQVVEAYIASRRNVRSGAAIQPGTLRTELGHLRNAINFAFRQGWLSSREIFPFPKLERPVPKSDFFDCEQIKRLLQASKHIPYLYLAVHLMVATGGRFAAVSRLTWGDVDTAQETIDLRFQGESGVTYGSVVPMNATIKRVLLMAQQGCRTKDAYIIERNGERIKSINDAFNSAAVRAGLPKASPEILRRSAAYRMAEAGRPLRNIAVLLGLKSLQTKEMPHERIVSNHLRAEVRALELPDDT